jgi:predicted NUDIX family phosphoesterase
MNDKEEVLVIPEEVLEPYLRYFKKNMLTDPGRIAELLDEALSPLACGYMPRAEAEIDPSYKQVIPYSVLWRGREVFRYKRTKKGGETRLHDLWSIGVGGHINPIDSYDDEPYEAAMWRELNEEVGLQRSNIGAPIVGIIYDPSNEVGKVHLGIVHFIQLGMNSPPMKYNDPALSSGEFHHVVELSQNSAKDVYENWSKIIIENLL